MNPESKPRSFGKVVVAGLLIYFVIVQASSGWKYLLLFLVAMLVPMLFYWRMAPSDSDSDRDPPTDER